MVNKGWQKSAGIHQESLKLSVFKPDVTESTSILARLLHVIGRGKKMKLLIVDDSNIMRRAIEKYLTDFNLELVGTAGDGEAALQLFKAHLPELVTLDITMPRMDGLACLDEIMRLRPETKVLVISALKDPSTGLQALRKGAKGFLAKPFSPEEIRSEFQQILGLSS